MNDSIKQIFIEARNSAIKSAYIPKQIRDNYNITHDVKSGKLIIKNKSK